MPIISDCDDPQLILTFVRETTNVPDAAGAIVAVNPVEWRLAYTTSKVALLDAAPDSALLVLPSGLSGILVNMERPDVFVSMDSHGVPYIHKLNRAALMQSAAGFVVRDLVPYGIDPQHCAVPEADQATACYRRRKKKASSGKAAVQATDQ